MPAAGKLVVVCLVGLQLWFVSSRALAEGIGQVATVQEDRMPAGAGSDVLIDPLSRHAMELELIDAYRRAHAVGSLQAVLDITCLESTPAEVVGQICRHFSNEFRKPLAGVEITSRRPDQTIEFVEDGLPYRFNVDVIANLRVSLRLTPSEGLTYSEYPIGIHRGRLLIGTPAQLP